MSVSVVQNQDWLGRSADNVVPIQYATTDRICQRWAVSIGMGLPTELWQDLANSRPPPLDDDIAIIVDQIILKSPEKTRRLIRAWYCTTMAQSVLADRLNLTERTLMTAWHLALHFLRYRFSESRHNGLIVLLKLRD